MICLGETFAADGEIVWTWRRDPGVYPARLCGLGNGDNKGRSPGRARISRKAIARGRPGCPGCTCQTRVRLLTNHCTRTSGCRRRPAFPAPSVLGGPTKMQNLGQTVSREHSLSSRTSERSERDPGPITTGRSYAKAGAPARFDNATLWLWVPAPVRNCALGREDSGDLD